MARIAFVTTGKSWSSDVEQIGHSTFLAEIAELADVVSLKSVLSSAFLAITDLLLDSFYAVVVTVGDSRARGQRLFQLRADTYAEVGRMLERERLWLQRIEPIIVIGDPLPIPENFDDGEWETLIGRIAVGSSAEVLALVEDVHNKFRAFQGYAFTYRQLRDTTARLQGSGQEMETARGVARDAIDATEVLMREELAGL
jgi:hypothetical protein